MGSDTIAFLPPETRADKIALVLEALTGHPLTRRPLSSSQHPGATSAHGHDVVRIEPWSHSFGSGSLTSPELPWLTIQLQGTNPLGQTSVRLSTGCYDVGTRLLTALCKFFGGVLVLDDCGGWDGEETKGNVLVFARPRASNDPEDGKEWQAFQDAMLAVEAIEPWRKPKPKPKPRLGGSALCEWPQPEVITGAAGHLCPQPAHEVARLLGLSTPSARSVTSARAWCRPTEKIIGSFRAPVTASYGKIERIAGGLYPRWYRVEQVAKGRPAEESEDFQRDGDLYVVYGLL